MAGRVQYEYGVDDVPPPKHLVLLSIQHVLIMFITLGFAIVFTSQISAPMDVTVAVISFTMLASGIGTIFQSLRLRFFGSGYLCPSICGPSYLSLSLSAAWVGGIPLMRGMIVIAGLAEMLLAPMMQKLKSVFPTYVVGLVVAMVGVSVITTSVSSLFGLAYRGDAIDGIEVAVGLFSLMVMVLSNVWGKGLMRMYCLLIGMIAGWTAALILIPEYRVSPSDFAALPVFAMPSMPWGLGSITFQWGLFLPFLIIAVSGTLKTFGNLLAVQKISNPDLREVDFRPIRNGLITDGFTTVMAGAMGAMAVDTSSSNIGLAGSTKVLSRWIATAAGAIFALLAFFPRFTAFISQMPKPVLGASIIFAGCFMIVTGLQEMFHEKWEPRQTFVVGIALIMGLSTAFLPELYARAPHLVQSFFTDPLPTATLIAVVLNQVVNLDRRFSRKNEGT
jgi:xanthine permease XanP